jgi:uncharacterized protein YkwD
MTARGSRGSSLTVSVLIAVVAVAGAIVLVVRLPGRASDTASASPAPASTSAAAPARAGGPPSRAARPASVQARGTQPARGHGRAHVTRPRASAGAAATAPTTPSSSRVAAGQPALSAADQDVLALINQARAQAGLPAYAASPGLDTSAARHTALMAGGCGLAHQCPGEPDLGARETVAGVQWTAAGENIGEGGPVADTPAAIAQLAVGLTQGMLDEKPPDDGHRLNILSSAFTQAGISVYRDSAGTVWMTQDFAN